MLKSIANLQLLGHGRIHERLGSSIEFRLMAQIFSHLVTNPEKAATRDDYDADHGAQQTYGNESFE